MPLSFYRSLLGLLSYFEVTVFDLRQDILQIQAIACISVYVLFAAAPTLVQQSSIAGSLVPGSILCQKLIATVCLLMSVVVVDLIDHFCLRRHASF